jgi:hypothetical protein
VAIDCRRTCVWGRGFTADLIPWRSGDAILQQESPFPDEFPVVQLVDWILGVDRPEQTDLLC